MAQYQLSQNQEYCIRMIEGVRKENNFGILTKGEYTYYSHQAEKEGWTWVTKEMKKGRRLKSGEKPAAWHTTQFGRFFWLYKEENFDNTMEF